MSVVIIATLFSKRPSEQIPEAVTAFKFIIIVIILNPTKKQGVSHLVLNRLNQAQ